MATEPRIYTGRYQEVKRLPDKQAVRITVGYPRFMGAGLPTIKDLAPYGLMKETDQASFTEGYVALLEAKGVQRIAQQLDDLVASFAPKAIVLCCYEDLSKPGEWCHRQTFSRWWLERTEELIPDLSGWDPAGCRSWWRDADRLFGH